MDAESEANLYRTYEKQRHDATRQRPILPVTIITGFLGAGKTTLLRKILRSKHNLRIAAVVNEYGSVDHDGGVVEREGLTDSVDKLAGGCVCCQASLGDELEVKVGELLRRPDHADDRYDYLVIETSGVSDPESIIRALDKTFGKLTRARLDSVVTVVDADALVHQLKDGQEKSMPIALRKQLESADVILLNKVDLLDTDRLSELSAKVRSVNPSARLESCSYGKVPLHAVLDVEAPRTDIQGVSHERVKTHLHVSSKGGNLRKAISSSSQTDRGRDVRTGSSGGDGQNDGGKVSHGHLRDDGLEQVTFTSHVPLLLARFQDWVSYGMPAGVVRVKGVLAFDEDRLTRTVFNMSGRRRVSFEDDGKWEGPMSLYLVVIGVGLDKGQVVAALEGIRVSTPGPRSVSKTSSIDGQSVESGDAAELNKQRNGPQEEVEACRLMKEILLKDPLFDAVPGTAHPPCPSNVVRFRFTGAGAYGIPPSLLSVKFGVDLDAVNRAILRTVNNGTTESRTALTNDTGDAVQGQAPISDARTTGVPVSRTSSIDDGSRSVDNAMVTASKTRKGQDVATRVFITSQEGVHLIEDEGRMGDEECVVLRYAVGGRVSLSEAWPSVTEMARQVMKKELGHVHFCNCFS